jgi:fused signal recognition particle receptor
MVFWRSKSKEASTTASPDSPIADAQGSQTKASASQTSAPAPATESSKGEPTKPEAPQSVFAKFKSGLQKTRQVLNTDIRDLFKAEGRLVDEEMLDQLFAKLVRTDMGAGPATLIRDDVATRFRGRVVHFEEVLQTIAAQTEAMLTQESIELRFADQGPTVILVVGVNGSGKTTSIGKLANHLTQSGKRVVLGAGDTFRAAAVEQLTIWAQRIGCDIVTAPAESDPASVAYKTVERAVEGAFDVAIIDTAGRLQTQSHLMQQLDKIRRVVGKKIEGAPHEVLLVLDATAGQNAISQARGFSDAAGCTGIVLSKLDGSAKGGVVLPIREQFGLPVKFVGLGEGIGDLAKFDAKSFASALFRD